MIKNKTKRKKYVFLFISLLILCSCILTPFASFAIPHPAEYNFSVLTNANLTSVPTSLNSNYTNNFVSLSSYDEETGSFTFTTKSAVTGTSTTILGQTLHELAPYLKAGDQIVISWDTDFEYTYSNQFQFLYGASFLDFYQSGTKITVTQQLLDSYFVFYPFAKGTQQGVSHTFSNFRINLDYAKPFTPYERTQDYVSYLNNIYTQGENDGYSQGANAITPYNALFAPERLKEVMTLYRYYDNYDQFVEVWSADTEETPNIFTALATSSVLNGYVIDSALFPSFVKNYGPSGSFLYEIGFFFEVGTFDSNGNRIAYLPLNQLEISVVLLPFTNYSLEIFLPNGEIYSESITNNSWNTVTYTFTSTQFGLPSDTLIEYINIDHVQYEYIEQDTSNIYYRTTYPAFFATTRTNEFVNGYTTGFANGKNTGYKEGYRSGANDGLSIGKQVGFEDGRTYGYNIGYQQGYDVGYNEGYDGGTNGGGWYQLFHAVVSAPVDVVSSMLNFNILGINMNVFFTSIITLCCLIALVRFIL